MGQNNGTPEVVNPQQQDANDSRERDIIVKRKSASERLGVELGSDLVVAGVLDEGSGKRFGIEIGMKVTKINGTAIQTEVDAVQAVQQSGLDVTFTIIDIQFETIRVTRQSMTERLGIELRSDLLIEKIHPGAATKTKLKSGMLVVTINNQLLRDESHAVEIISEAGLIVDFKVVVERPPPERKTAISSESEYVIENYNPEEKLGVDLSPSMIIISVSENSVASGSGLTPGMKIKKINNIEVETASDMTRALRESDNKIIILVGIEPDGAAEKLLQPILSVVSSLPLPFHALSDSVIECLPTTLIKCDVMRTAEAESVPSSQLSVFGGPVEIPIDDAVPPPKHVSSKESWEAPSPSEVVNTIPG